MHYLVVYLVLTVWPIIPHHNKKKEKRERYDITINPAVIDYLVRTRAANKSVDVIPSSGTYHPHVAGDTPAGPADTAVVLDAPQEASAAEKHRESNFAPVETLDYSLRRPSHMMMASR